MKKLNQRIDLILKAIADPTRREIFHALVLASTALPITSIAANYDISRQGITKHIKTLEKAGLISIDSQGRERYCKAIPSELKHVNDWLNFYDKFWDDSLNRLGDHLDDME